MYLSLKIFLKNGGEAVSLQSRRVARQLLEIFGNRCERERKHDRFADFLKELAVDGFQLVRGAVSLELVVEGDLEGELETIARALGRVQVVDASVEVADARVDVIELALFAAGREVVA